MEWLYYLLEANLYLLLFYVFYRVALAKTTFYTSNRYYLVISSLTAFLLPIVQLGFLNPKPIIDNILFPPPIVYPSDQLANMNFAPVQETFSVADFLYPIYLIIALGFAIKMGFGLYKITILWLKAKKLQSGTITIVELDGEKSAFSFFNLLFIHPHLAEKQTILTHEMVHIKQRHSLDIVFFEILQIICWFNPIIYFIQTDIKLLHEYIADELSVTSDQEKHEYAMFLIENSFGIIPQRLTNQIFNQSILKRRINMLNKKRTAGWARLRLLLALPLVGGMLCASTMAFTKDYGYLDLLPENAILQEPATKVSSEEKMAKEGRYAPSYIFDQQSQYKSLEKRLIIVNGIVIKDNNKYYGNRNADKIVFLNAQNATDKYGDSAKYGAVEVSGSKTVLVYQPPYLIADTAKFPPPIVKPDRKSNNQEPRVQNIKKTKKDQVKFPPPIVKPDGKNLKTAQPIVPPPPPKQDKIKFPPPIVKPIQKSKKTPLSVKPPAPKQDKVKFRPRVLKQDKNNTKDQSSDKLKIQEQVKINQRFLIERLKDQAINKNAQKLMIEKQRVEAINEMTRQINLAKEKREEEKARKKLNG